jgi:uncharacterized protein (DUF4415 family)
MSEENMKTYSMEEVLRLHHSGASGTDWARVDALRDEEIDFSDIPELGERFWGNSRIIAPLTVQNYPHYYLPVDADIFRSYASGGGDYIERINAILRAHIPAPLPSQPSA